MAKTERAKRVTQNEMHLYLAENNWTVPENHREKFLERKLTVKGQGEKMFSVATLELVANTPGLPKKNKEATEQLAAQVAEHNKGTSIEELQTKGKELKPNPINGAVIVPVAKLFDLDSEADEDSKVYARFSPDFVVLAKTQQAADEGLAALKRLSAKK